MRRLLTICVLLLAAASVMANTKPSAQLPLATVNSDYTLAQIAMVSAATLGDTCNSAAHVWCVTRTGVPLTDGIAAMAAFTSAAAASSSIGEVVVLPPGRYDLPTGSAPFSVAGGCYGNGVVPAAETACRGYFPVTSGGDAKPIIIVSAHWHHFPASGTRVIARTGDGYFFPSGMTPNVSSGDWVTFSTPNVNAPIWFGHNVNGVFLDGIEIRTDSTLSYVLAMALGQGHTAARGMYVNNGSEHSYLTQAFVINTGSPFVQVTGCDTITPTIATTCNIVGYNTNLVAGSSTAQVTWNALAWPASDVAIGNDPACASGATVAPHICVIDATHATIILTGIVLSPSNGGVHTLSIDTGSGYAAGTEHAPATDGFVVVQPQAWTLTCATCLAGTGMVVQKDGAAHTVIAQGTTSGAGQTHWTAALAHILTFNHVGNILKINSQSLNESTQTITASVTAGTTIAIRNSATVRSSNTNPVLGTSEIDVKYKGVENLNESNHGIDYCTLAGSTFNQTNIVARGGTYSLTCFGIGTTWPSGMSCSGTCNQTITGPVTFGSDFVINSVTRISNTQLTVNFTVGADADMGSSNIHYKHIWLHTADGNIVKQSDGVTPCTLAAGPTEQCTVINSKNVTTGLELEADNGSITDSFIDGMHSAGITDTQAIAFLASHGPTKITNNFIQYASEGIFTGGAGAYQRGFTPSIQDATIQGNWLYRPPAYYKLGVTVPCTTATIPACSGVYSSWIWSPKTTIEFKSCNRVLMIGNVIDGQWPGPVKNYKPYSVTPRSASGQGTPLDSCDDTTLTENLFVGTYFSEGLTADDVNGTMSAGGDDSNVQGTMSVTEARRGVVTQNLMVPTLNENSTGAAGSGSPWQVNIGKNLQDWLHQHNTILFPPWNTSTLGRATYFNVSFGTCTQVALDETKNFWWLDNVSNYGWAGDDGCTLDKYFSTPTVSPNGFANRLAGNVWAGASVACGTGCSATNSFSTVPSVTTQIGSSNWIVNEVFQGDYTLLSPAGWVGPSANTTDGASGGVDWAVLSPYIAAALTGGSGVSPVVVTTTSLPDGTITVPYSQTLSATGGTGPYTWSVTAGALPTSLSLSSGGVISGTPTVTGLFSFTVQACDTLSVCASQPLTITIHSAVTVLTTILPHGTAPLSSRREGLW